MTSPTTTVTPHVTQAKTRVTLRSLHNGLLLRPTPEEVSAQIVELLDLGEDATIFPKARFRSQMGRKFDRPVGLQKRVDLLADLMGMAHVDGNDPSEIRIMLAGAMGALGMTPGHVSFKSDRLNRSERRATRSGQLSSMSRRRYDKLFRIVASLSDEVGELEDHQQLADLARFAKIGFADRVPFRAFKQTPGTAAFIAYYTANLGRRSMFTSGRQARAMDRAAEFLLKRLEDDPKTSWFAVAHVFPRWDVLARCSVKERADLLEMARAQLEQVAVRLSICVTPTMNLNEMIVQRGDDSSTWNALAGSWNKARDMWFAAGWSLDPSIMDALAPGKALRLMAADVVRWHRSTNGLDPDTKVWASLPRPWDVMIGVATCTREQVRAACLAAGVDPETTGWTKPRPRTQVDAVYATPELVHGVVVSHPQLALLLRKAGWFAAKPSKVKEVAPAIGAAGVVERADHELAFGPTVKP